ncbi:MAG: type II toxin-antitoxin system RelE/ParE family toxin [Pseudomonadota bacterium]
MKIESVRHKALRAFLETGKPKGIDARVAGRLRNMIAFLVAAGSVDEFRIPPNFGFHWLTGDRAGTAAMTMTKNWRLTFRVSDTKTLIDLDLEDYH